MEQQQKKQLSQLNDYIAIGFDIDHCLVQYNLPNFLPLMYETFAKTLIEKHDYPSIFAEFTKEDLSFAFNPLLIDTTTHYIIKLGKDKKILRAYYGYEPVEESKLQSVYGNPPIFTNYDPTKPKGDNYFFCVTFFELTAPVIYAKVVEYKKRNVSGFEKIEFSQIFSNIMDAVVSNYVHYNLTQYFSVTKFGFFFPAAIEQIDTIIPKQDRMLEILKQLRAKGIVLFLVTNSHVEYLEYLMDHAYGKEWRHLFAIVCAKAGKPTFFTHPERKFVKYDPSMSTRAGESLEELEYEKHHIVIDEI